MDGARSGVAKDRRGSESHENETVTPHFSELQKDSLWCHTQDNRFLKSHLIEEDASSIDRFFFFWSLVSLSLLEMVGLPDGEKKICRASQKPRSFERKWSAQNILTFRMLIE